MRKKNTTTDNVKIVFYDVLAQQIDKLISIKDMISTSASNANELNNEFESQFELLRDTLTNVENLMNNVNKTNGEDQDYSEDEMPKEEKMNLDIPVATSDTQEKNTFFNNSVTNNTNDDELSDDDIDEPPIENTITMDNSQSSETNSEQEEKEDDMEISPLIPVSPSTEKINEDLIKNYNIDEANKNDDNDESKDKKDEESPEKPPIPLVPDNILVNNSEESETTPIEDESYDDDSTDTEDDENEINEPEDKKSFLVNIPEKQNSQVVQNDKIEITKCFKLNDKQTKAIVVNAQQLEKLRLSRQIQESKLDFGVTQATSSSNISTNNDNVDIQQLLKQASDLYKQGNAIEAEKIYERIRELNKK